MVTQGAAGTDRPQHRRVAGQRCREGERQTWALMRPEEEEKAAAIPLSGGQTPHHTLDGTDPHPSTPRHCRPQFLLPFVRERSCSPPSRGCSSGCSRAAPTQPSPTPGGVPAPPAPAGLTAPEPHCGGMRCQGLD